MRIFRYDWYGALAGVGLPLLGTALEAMRHFGSLAPSALWEAHLDQPLVWIMDTTPVVLGGLGRIIVRQHGRLVRQSEELVRRSEEVVQIEQARREAFERTARELAGAAQALLGSVSQFGETTSAAAAGVRETAAAMGQISQSATSAAITAEAVIGLAGRSERAGGDGLGLASPPRGELERLVESAKEIAQAARRQEEPIEQALAAVKAISRAIDDTVASTRAVEREARSLSELASSLQAAVRG